MPKKETQNNKRKKKRNLTLTVQKTKRKKKKKEREKQRKENKDLRSLLDQVVLILIIKKGIGKFHGPSGVASQIGLEHHKNTT